MTHPLFASLLSNLLQWLNNAYAIALVIVGIGFVIFIHELGHFAVAKWAGVKVEMFSLGFGPTLFSWRRGFGLRRGSTVREYNARITSAEDEVALAQVLEKYGETEYSVRILPLGGFVAWLGEDPNEPDGKSRDPRSFNMKPVGSRMAIVCAGVIMNLAFGILCSAWSHHKGKLETPPIIGAVAAGTPAYLAGIKPGDEVVAIDGRTGITYESLQKATQLSRAGQKIKFDIKRPGQDKPIQVELEPKRTGNAPAPAIGVLKSESLELAGKTPEGLLGHGNETNENEYDKITAAGPVGSKPSPVFSILELNTILARDRSQPIVLVANRLKSDDRAVSPKPVEVTVPPKPYLDFGFWLTPGPVTAIQEGSPAKAAGFQVGDRIVSIDGLEAFDPMTLPDLFSGKAGKACLVEVQRGSESSKHSIRVEPDDSVISGASVGVAEPLKIPSLGMAVEIEPKVSNVIDGSSASKAGVKVGAILTKVQFESKDAPSSLQKTLDLDNKALAWPVVLDAIQEVPGPVKFTFGKGESVTLNPAPVEGRFDVSRDLHFTFLYRVHAPEPLGVALRKGGEDALEITTSIVGLLRNVVTGRLGANSVGGPIPIFKMSYDTVKSGGLADFLPFLGFLSINLAVMNFFPIPPLDGGQMVFLVAEKVRGRPLPDNAVLYPMILGGIFIIALFIVISVKDVWSLF